MEQDRLEGDPRMEDIRNRLQDLQVKSEVLNTSFSEHKIQNRDDFIAVDDDIKDVLQALREHRAESTAQAKEMQAEIDALKRTIYTWGGAIAVLVSILNMIPLDRIFG